VTAQVNERVKFAGRRRSRARRLAMLELNLPTGVKEEPPTMTATTDRTKTVVNGIRTALGVGGLLALIVGILILAWPGKTAMVVTAIIAVYAIVAGFVYAGLGIFTKTRGGWSRVGYILLGVVFVIAGIVAFANLAQTTAWLAFFLGVLVGVMWIIEGAVALVTIRESASKVWGVIFAIISIVAGIVLIIAPIWGAVTLWWLLGISLIVLGVINIVRAFTYGNRRS